MEISRSHAYGISAMLVDKLLERGMLSFTAAQTAALEAGLCQGQSMLVAAPTSSGKTTIAELAAVEAALKGYKTVYLVSHRALAEEKFRLFKKQYATPNSEWFDVSIATGDHTEGVWNAGILVATYEKYLASLCGRADFNLSGIVVVADEIQILGSERRGPEIELLCTLLKRGHPKQLVALSATISNPQDVAAWLGCKVIHIISRDVPLRQEVWFRGKSLQCLAGTTELFDGKYGSVLPSQTIEAVDHLLRRNRGPVLVFTMTKPRALELAEEFSNRRQRTPEGIGYADQLELFSEPSTLMRTLTETAQRKVAFHTADLNHAERELIERGLTDKLFDVVFASPTLAAGVNFPFQTVLFDSFYRAFVPNDPWLPLADYSNMAGRAGRLGLHDEGFSILLAESDVHFERARTLISSHVDPLYSRFFTCSLRKVILTIIASRVVRKRDDLMPFIQETLWWNQAIDRNPKKLEEIPAHLDLALEYLQASGLVSNKGNNLFATRLGVATAGTGLLPSTVVDLLQLFRNHEAAFGGNEDQWIPGVLHASCASDEYGSTGQRNLPYSRRGQPENGAYSWLSTRNLFRDGDAVEAMDKVTNACFGLSEWIKGTSERMLRNMLPLISYGQMQQLANENAAILEGISKVMRVPDSKCIPLLPNLLITLAERLRYGAPADVLDLLRASAAYRVPGFGRHRAMTLGNAKLATPNSVLQADRKLITRLVESAQRAVALADALVSYFDVPLEVFKTRHISRASELQLDAELIQRSYELTGDSYEDAIEALLKSVPEWEVMKIDKGKRQAFPDFLIEYQGKAVLVECKTKERNSATISKDEAFAVLTKGVDFKKDHCLTIGKPDFDETSKGKANGAVDVTLMRHHDFVEALLRYKSGKVSAEQLFSWILTPGYAVIEQLEAFAINAGDQ